jgi:hypothetical protein
LNEGVRERERERSSEGERERTRERERGGGRERKRKHSYLPATLARVDGPEGTSGIRTIPIIRTLYYMYCMM